MPDSYNPYTAPEARDLDFGSGDRSGLRRRVDPQIWIPSLLALPMGLIGIYVGSYIGLRLLEWRFGGLGNADATRKLYDLWGSGIGFFGGILTGVVAPTIVARTIAKTLGRHNTRSVRPQSRS